MTTKHKPALPIAAIETLARKGQFKNIMAEVLNIAAMSKIEPAGRLNDLNAFENCRCECSPYLLRWHRTESIQDPLGQIYDDYMNDLMQSGDRLDLVAIFAWHNEVTLANAIKRFGLFCQFVQAAEKLLITIAPKSI